MAEDVTSKGRIDFGEREKSCKFPVGAGVVSFGIKLKTEKHSI